MTDKRIVLSTACSEEEARKIARHLVEHQLRRLRQHRPARFSPSTDGKVRWKTAQEWLLLIKTTARKVSADVSDAIRELHSYDLPECIAHHHRRRQCRVPAVDRIFAGRKMTRSAR